MKYECELIKDLLPLYQDDTASNESKYVVEKHLSECSACKEYLNKMKYNLSKSTVVSETIEISGYKRLAKKLRFRRAFICLSIAMSICLTITIAYAYADGVRFNAQQAVNYSPYVDDKSTILGEVGIGPYKVFFYENDDKYRTIIAEEYLSVWKLNRNSFWANKTDDTVKMVGWCSFTDNESGKSITAIPIQCFDSNVAYIEMGPEGDRVIKDVVYKDLIVFTWKYSIKWNDLNAIAYSGNNEPLYKLGYDKKNGTIKTDELRWLPVE